MLRVRQGALVALTAAALAAGCTDSPLEPTPSDLQPTFARVGRGASATTSAGASFFVVARGSTLPESFDLAVSDAGGTVQAAYPDLGVAVVTGLDDQGARSLRRLKGIQFVEAEPMFTLDEPVGLGDPEGFGGSIESPANPEAAFFYPRQWNMRQIDAPGAWAAGRLGSSGVAVAILDTGIDYLHLDLAGRVDLGRSVSFVPEDDYFVELVFGDTRHPVTDIGFHGTHVANTVVSNGWGAAGVTSGVTLIGIKVCSVALDACPGGAVFAGIVHAVQSGADVANLSLGGAFRMREFPGAVSAFQRLFNWTSQSGTLFVVSAGNESADLDHDQDGFNTYCSVANVVCVSATAPTGADFAPGGFAFTDPDAPASYTNYGRSAIAVAAPGGDFYEGVIPVTGVFAACSSSSLLEGLEPCRTRNDFYVFVAGTSMAAPHVTGVAALLVEDLGRDPAEIRARLQQSADDLGQPGTDPFYGKGRLNAAAAVGG